MNLLQRFSTELEELVASTTPAVVSIHHRRGQGTGFVIAPDGYVLTNHHVLRRRPSVDVQLHTGAGVTARVVGRDAATDLAVLHVETAGLKSLPLATSRRVEVGQIVVAIGNPFRYERSVSIGVISALDRIMSTPQGHVIEGAVQTDAAINPGNSGGPLINAWGDVVGVNTAIIAFAQGIGFAIPAETASWVAGLLIQHGEVRRRFLGVAAKAAHLAPEVATSVGQDRAVRILDVAKRSPADDARLVEGDLLLTVDEHRLAGVSDLQRILAHVDRERVELTVLRGGRVERVEVAPRVREAA